MDGSARWRRGFWEVAMKATVGDRLHMHGHAVGEPDRIGTVIEVKGADGGPPYRVRFPDGHESLVFPGPDATVDVAPA
jgi:hypothetical protein